MLCHFEVKELSFFTFYVLTYLHIRFFSTLVSSHILLLFKLKQYIIVNIHDHIWIYILSLL